MWAGVAGAPINNNTEFEVAISVHDSVYTTDFSSIVIPYSVNTPDKNAKEIEQLIDAYAPLSCLLFQLSGGS